MSALAASYTVKQYPHVYGGIPVNSSQATRTQGVRPVESATCCATKNRSATCHSTIRYRVRAPC